jgi:hypothetical protein
VGKVRARANDVIVTWDAVVIQWLTFGSSAEAEKNLIHSTRASMSIPLVPHLTSTNDDRDGELGNQPAVHGLPKEPPTPLTLSTGLVDISNISKDRTVDITQSAPVRGS